MKNSLKNSICEFLTSKQEEQVLFLSELVKFPSDNPPGNCTPHAALAASLLEKLGYEVERYEVPKKIVDENGMISVTNLVIRERFDNGLVIALNAHGDVVPPGLGWKFDPYGAEIHQGFMYGRGVAVSKSDIATYAFALLALKFSGYKFKGTVELHFTYDEETGGNIGPQYLLEQEISKPDYVISAGFSYGVTVAHSGCLHLEVEIRGQSAHAALPESGCDALEATTQVLAELYNYRKNLKNSFSSIEGIGNPNLTIGLISGGINTNVVPDCVVFRLDRRIIPEENSLIVEKNLRDLIDKSIISFPGISVTIRRIMLAEPFVPMEGQDFLIDIITKNANSIMGEKVLSQGIPLFTDARIYAAAGIPTVLYGAGPHDVLEANGHRANEKLELEILYKATQVIALSLGELLY